MKLDCIRNILTQIFGRLGEKIARNPLYFILIPLTLSLSLSVGIFYLSINENTKEFVEADNGQAVNVRVFVKKMFPFNASVHFDMMRNPYFPEAFIMYIVKKDFANMFEEDVLMEIKTLNEVVVNSSFVFENVSISYSEICAIVNKKCFENPISKFMKRMSDTKARRWKIKYPYELDLLTLSYELYGLNLGGVDTDRQENVKNLRAIRLVYPFDISSKWKHEWIDEWEANIMKIVDEYPFQHIKVFRDPFKSLEADAKILCENLKPMIGAVTAFIAVFSCLSCMSMNFVRSKPWLGVATVVSAGLAITTAFGLMGLCGIQSTYWNICIPFLVVVTEIDDAFLLIACWRSTDQTNDVNTRMRETYSEAGISVTLTSVTNFLAYCIGMMAAFPLVRTFCYYCATSMLFTYIYQITFFGGCMALSGYREEKKLHPITLRSPDSKTIERQIIHHQKDEIRMKMLKKRIGNIFSYSFTKIIIMVLYIVNMGMGIWGLFSIRQGIDWQNIYPYDSPISESLRIMYKNFGEYTFPVQIIINQTLDYSDMKIQQTIETVMKKFETLPHIADSHHHSWLKYYKIFQEHPVSKYSLSGYNMSNKQDFLDGLRYVFLRVKGANDFANDIVFNEDDSDIVCSRFFLLAINIVNRETEMNFLADVLEIADEAPFRILVHSILSNYIEQAVIIRGIITQLFWVTTILILILFFIFIPNAICSILVAVSVVSTITETLGFMSLWGVNLDLFSMMSLIMCVGFSINFPAHMSHSFVMSSFDDINEKLKHCLYHLGYPILQGSLSSIFGILFLYGEHYMFLVFIKMVFLITVLTVFHAVFVIPVVLSFQLFNRRKDDVVLYHAAEMQALSGVKN